MNTKFSVIADDEFAVGMEFNSKNAVVTTMKDYTIHRSVDYRHDPQEVPCWVIRRCNDSHIYTKATISQDYSKLNSNTIAEVIKPLVEADPIFEDESRIRHALLAFTRMGLNEVFEVCEMLSGLEYAIDLRGPDSMSTCICMLCESTARLASVGS
ncbi:hypothetical protein Ahy_B05g076492 [Arachis hypogaea]|uniref:Uncharacterized protein n=1 Tax=Arachis hypogaea TaxID=3818 RepID=A0A444Z3B6_ARAHY|nr:hypothetical protein Ahy_B05g076492 [Arachis hypogaea]